jgi:cytochrome c oxidase assembly protein Cox11
MVTPNMFTSDLYKYENLPKECFFVDDNYFSAHLKKNGVKILMVGMAYKAIPLPEMNACQIGALHGNQNHDGRNERVVNKYFGKGDKIDF